MELFRRGSQWRGFGSRRLASSFGDFASEFWQAAQVSSATNASEPTSIRCPVAYLYRQAIELYVKAVITESGQTRPEEAIGRRHGLRSHVKDLKEVADELRFKFSPDFEETLRQLDRVDPSSTKFRYPGVGTGPPDFDMSHFVEQAEQMVEQLAELYALGEMRIYRSILDEI